MESRIKNVCDQEIREGNFSCYSYIRRLVTKARGLRLVCIAMLLCGVVEMSGQCDDDTNINNNKIEVDLTEVDTKKVIVGSSFGVCCDSDANMPNMGSCVILSIMLDEFSDGISIVPDGPNQCSIKLFNDFDSCPTGVSQGICDPI